MSGTNYVVPGDYPVDSALEPLESPVEASPAGAGVALVPVPLEASSDSTAARAAAVDKAVREWVRDRLSSSPVSRHTDAWNHLLRELPALCTRLMEV